MTSRVQQTSVELALKQHNARLTALERSDGSNRWILVNPEGGPDTDPEGPEFQNGWANLGAPFAPVAFKRFSNWVHIRGAFGGGPDNSVVFTLPEPYWPTMLTPLNPGTFSDYTAAFTLFVDVDGTVNYVQEI